MATRDYSDMQEKHIAMVTGGNVQSNSGGTKFGGGDVHTKKFFIEAKTPTECRKSFSIKTEWLEKMWEQAFEQGKEEELCPKCINDNKGSYNPVCAYCDDFCNFKEVKK